MPDIPAGYIADTNVVSNRAAPSRDSDLVEWLRRHAGQVRISVVTIAEMRRGLFLLERKIALLSDRTVRLREQRRLDQKQSWYATITDLFADRILPIDLAAAEKWAEISVRFPSLKDADKAIAATAMARGYAIATENLGDFRQVGVTLVNPFDRATWVEHVDDDPVRPLLRR